VILGPALEGELKVAVSSFARHSDRNQHYVALCALCRVMLFGQMLGLKNVWGCEDDWGKVYKADTALRRTYGSMMCPEYIITNSFEIVHAGAESFGMLPTGASVIYMFWQGLKRAHKKHIGKLAIRCPTFKLLCIVQNGTEELNLNALGFPEMRLVKQLKVTSQGGGQFQAYIFQREINM
jgi:hypothetical protein